MFDISFESNITAVEKDLTRFERKQIPFATAVALTRTAKDAEKVLKATMKRVFDRPTPYTLRGTMTRPATKQKLVASVGFRDFAGKGTPAGKYLRPQIEGGPRRSKKSERLLRQAGLLRSNEYIVPSKAIRLNRYGNITGGQMQKIISGLRAQNDQHQNRTARSARGKAAGYFVPNQGSKLPRGVWERRGKKIKPLLIFVKRPTYQKRLPFNKIIKRTVERRMPYHFQRELGKAIAGAYNR